MPSTVRLVSALTDPEASNENNLDWLFNSDGGRYERLSLPAFDDTRIYWPLSGELHVMLQIWIPPPRTAEAPLKIWYPGTEGWSINVPIVGRIPFMLYKPATIDYMYMTPDTWSIEVALIWF